MTMGVWVLLLHSLSPPSAADNPKTGDTTSRAIVLTVGATAVGPVNRNIFGGCYNDVREHIDAWRYMGLTTCREGRPGLQSPARLEPEPGSWRWEEYDAWLDWLRANEATGLALLTGAADWMMRGGKQEPADWAYFIRTWSDFAAEVVRHTNIERKTGIRYWEIWNEPDDGFWFERPWGGDPEHYSALFRSAARAMKAVDPTVVVGTGGIADPWGGSLESWWEPCLRDFGIGQVLDFVCLHGYYGDPIDGKWRETLVRTRKLMQQYIGHEVPIWVTEFNADYRQDFVKRGLSHEKQALYVAETLAVFASEGVDAAQYFCIGWYGSDFCPWDHPEPGGARPVVNAYHFWRDYRGEQLAVEVSKGEVLAAVGCKHQGRRIMYFTADVPGTYDIHFAATAGSRRLTAVAFDGNTVENVAPEIFIADSATGTGRLQWTEGRRALVKVILDEASQ